MTFHDYLQMRLHGERGALERSIAALCAIEDWPDAFDGWRALRAWLISVATRPTDIRTASGAWISYQRFLKAQGLEMPRLPGKPVYGLPTGVQTVMDAPPLVRLRELDHRLKLVAQRAGSEAWDWQGDLTDIVELRIYVLMRDIHTTLTQLMRYIDDGLERRQVLFAKIANGVDAGSAYQRASEAVLADARRHPRWLRLRHPYDGLEAAR